MARPIPHACTEPYQPGIAVAGIQIHATATITDWIQPSYNPTSFPGSPLPSLGTDRREPWERGWLQFWTEEIGNLVIPPPPPLPFPPKKIKLFFLRDSRASETRVCVKTISREKGETQRGFSLALAFPSLYYPWGKMGTTRNPEGKWHFLVFARLHPWFGGDRG